MQNKDIPIMILAGGRGTRLMEETREIPKPMVTVGGKPILLHLMQYYSRFGFRKFIVCLGYKGEIIKEYFLNVRERKGRDGKIHIETSWVKEFALEILPDLTPQELQQLATAQIAANSGS